MEICWEIWRQRPAPVLPSATHSSTDNIAPNGVSSMTLLTRMRGSCQCKSWHRSLEQQWHCSRDNNLAHDEEYHWKVIAAPGSVLAQQKPPPEHDPSLKWSNLLIFDKDNVPSHLGCTLHEGIDNPPITRHFYTARAWHSRNYVGWRWSTSHLLR